MKKILRVALKCICKGNDSGILRFMDAVGIGFVVSDRLYRQTGQCGQLPLGNAAVDAESFERRRVVSRG